MENEHILVTMVRDLENIREQYDCYSYVRTIRNILNGNPDSIVADVLKSKKYFGMIKGQLTLQLTEQLMDSLVKEGKLELIYTKHGKLYCTQEYYLSSGQNH